MYNIVLYDKKHILTMNKKRISNVFNLARKKFYSCIKTYRYRILYSDLYDELSFNYQF